MKDESEPVGWTEDRLRAEANRRGWYVRESASVPNIDGGWWHPFTVTASSHELCELLNAPPGYRSRPMNEKTPRSLQYRIARAWASIEGKIESFDTGETRNDELGHFQGYMAEAAELMKRTGLVEPATDPAAISAYLSSAGLVVVPEEPTEAMMIAGATARHSESFDGGYSVVGVVDAKAAWNAMVAAAKRENCALPAARGKGLSIAYDNGERFGTISEMIAEIRRLRATLDLFRDPSWPAIGRRFMIEHDGFSGDLRGYYLTREGKRGVVLQQEGTRVVHVYGEKWLKLKENGDG